MIRKNCAVYEMLLEDAYRFCKDENGLSSGYLMRKMKISDQMARLLIQDLIGMIDFKKYGKNEKVT